MMEPSIVNDGMSLDNNITKRHNITNNKEVKTYYTRQRNSRVCHAKLTVVRSTALPQKRWCIGQISHLMLNLSVPFIRPNGTPTNHLRLDVCS